MLNVAAAWDAAYSGNRNRFVLRCRGADGREPKQVRLLAQPLDGIPVAAEDLWAGRWHDPGHYLLFNLDDDPAEQRNLVHDHPEAFERMRRELLALAETRKRKVEAIPRVLRGGDPPSQEPRLHAMRGSI